MSPVHHKRMHQSRQAATRDLQPPSADRHCSRCQLHQIIRRSTIISAVDIIASPRLEVSKLSMLELSVGSRALEHLRSQQLRHLFLSPRLTLATIVPHCEPLTTSHHRAQVTGRGNLRTASRKVTAVPVSRSHTLQDPGRYGSNW